jgi:hypothetical protein
MDQTTATYPGRDPEFAALLAACAAAHEALREAHRAADARLAAGDTSDLLPGIDPERAIAAARRSLGL